MLVLQILGLSIEFNCTMKLIGIMFLLMQSWLQWEQASRLHCLCICTWQIWHTLPLPMPPTAASFRLSARQLEPVFKLSCQLAALLWWKWFCPVQHKVMVATPVTA